MAGLGLIGTAIAGGMAGAGEAGVKSGLQLQKQFGDEDLQKMKAASDLELATSMENLRQKNAVAFEREVRQPFTTSERKDTQTFTAEQQGRSQAFQVTLQNAGFTHTEEMARDRQNFDLERDATQGDLTREQIASSEKIAIANQKNALAIANIGGTISQDKDGNMLFFNRQGKPTQIMDPNNPSKPLVGIKDLSAAAKQYAEVIKAQLVGLDKEELVVFDDAGKTKIVERRSILNNELLNVLTGGIQNAGPREAYDPATKQVKVDGNIIPGTAANADEAKAMVKAFREASQGKAGSPATPSATGAKPAGIVAGARADPARPSPTAPITAMTRVEQQGMESKSASAAQAKDSEALKGLDREVSAEFEQDIRGMTGAQIVAKYQNKTDALTTAQKVRMNGLISDARQASSRSRGGQ